MADKIKILFAIMIFCGNIVLDHQAIFLKSSIRSLTKNGVITMLMDQVQETIAYIEQKTTLKPKVAIVLGSGLNSLADELQKPCVIAYKELPHFVVSTAPGHQGNLIFGYLDDVPVLCMQGRLHVYEGYSLETITYPIRVMAALGIEKLILSNAAGGIDIDFAVGDLMIISDHINFMGRNPLIGANETEFGPRFNDMTFAYDRELRGLAHQTAEELGIKLQEGVYLSCTGPSYETPAEIRMFRSWGANAVGMSTVPEVIVAAHCGLKVLAISCISNMAAGILDQPLTEEEVLATGAKVSHDFCRLVKAITAKL